MFYIKLKMVVESAGEKEVRRVAEKIIGEKFPKIRHPQIINPRTKRPLELDCYNERRKLAFEYDGKHHYEDVKFWTTKLPDIRYRDAVKDRECHRLEILLIRIPYTIKLEDIESYMTRFLKGIFRREPPLSMTYINPVTINHRHYPPNIESTKSINLQILHKVNKGVLMIDFIANPLPKIKVDKHSLKSKSNTNLNEENNWCDTPAMIECFFTGGHKIIFGKENIGKTSWSKYILDYKCIIVERFNDLKLFDHGSHNGIIFENIDFSNIHDMIITALIHREDRILRFKEKDVFLPASTEMIFTSNKPDGLIFGNKKSAKRHYKSCYRLKLSHVMYVDNDDSDNDEPLFVYEVDSESENEFSNYRESRI